jgi:DnaJ family protein C protein 13
MTGSGQDDNNVLVPICNFVLIIYRHTDHLKKSPETPWRSPHDEAAVSNISTNGNIKLNQSSANLQNELVISGIYIRLFIANPGWVLRKPREFLIDLMENILQLMNSKENNNEKLEALTTALIKLLEAQPPLAEIVPATGYISRILSSLSTSGSGMQKPCVVILHQLSRYAIKRSASISLTLTEPPPKYFVGKMR